MKYYFDFSANDIQLFITLHMYPRIPSIVSPTEQINMVQIESIMSQITSNSDLREQWKESIILRVCV